MLVFQKRPTVRSDPRIERYVDVELASAVELGSGQCGCDAASVGYAGVVATSGAMRRKLRIGRG
jgi:hypothetical protein